MRNAIERLMPRAVDAVVRRRAGSSPDAHDCCVHRLDAQSDRFRFRCPLSKIGPSAPRSPFPTTSRVLAAAAVVVLTALIGPSRVQAVDVEFEIHFVGEEQPETPPNTVFTFHDTDAVNQQEYNLQQLLAAMRRGDNFGVTLRSGGREVDLEFREGEVLVGTVVLNDGTRHDIDEHHPHLTPQALDYEILNFAHNNGQLDYPQMVRWFASVPGFTQAHWSNETNRKSLAAALAFVSYLVMSARVESLELWVIAQFTSTAALSIDIGMVYLLRFWDEFYDWASSNAADTLEFFRERFHLGAFVQFFRRFAVRPGRQLDAYDRVIYAFLFWTVANCARPA